MRGRDADECINRAKRSPKNAHVTSSMVFKAGAGQGDRKYPGLISVVSGQLWPVAMTTWSNA